MARGANENQKNKRTVSRREQIKNLFEKFPESEIRELSEQLDLKTDSELRSEKLFLYFTQLGKCMYSGQVMQLVLGSKWEEYVKRLSSFVEKYNEAAKMKITDYKITTFHKIDRELNCELYDVLKHKLATTPYKVLMPTPSELLEKSRSLFEQLSPEDQSIALLHIIELFGCSSGGCDLTLINGSKAREFLK